MSTHYPDLVAPRGWTYFRVGTQIRLIPPGTRADTAAQTIIVSPLVARTPQMPGAAMLIQLALEAEAKVSFEITAQGTPGEVTTATGLRGASLEVTGYARPAHPVERRIYVMLIDDLCLYGLSYLASAAAFDEHVGTFWALVESVKPFVGRQAGAPPTPPSPFSAD